MFAFMFVTKLKYYLTVALLNSNKYNNFSHTH